MRPVFLACRPDRFLGTLILLAVLITGGCRRYRDDLDYSHEVQALWPLEEFGDREIVQFRTVFWEPDDTISLRKLIVEDQIASGRRVLEIGTGTGLLSILCQRNGAATVVATDINPAAVANARYNAAMLGAEDGLEVRQVDPERPDAFSVIGDQERFDLIVSNPPWEDQPVNAPAEYAFYDPGFELMDSILDGLSKHLRPGGRCLLAYGHVPAIVRLRDQAVARGMQVTVLDDRDLGNLPTDFLPGMLVEVRLNAAAATTGTPSSS